MKPPTPATKNTKAGKIEVRFDSNWPRFERYIAQLPEKLAEAEQDLLDQCAAVALSRNRRRFLDEVTPDDRPWTPSKAAIKRRQFGDSGTLYDTGRLFHSIQLSRKSTKERDIGTSVPYAPDLIGRWPFLGFNDADRQLMDQISRDLLSRAIQIDGGAMKGKGRVDAPGRGKAPTPRR